MYSYVVHPTAFPIVTSLKPCDSYTCTVPITLPDNVTFECAVNSPAMSDPIWEIDRSQYLSSQLPLKNIRWHISSGSNLLKSQGYLLKNTFQNSSTLDITQQARQEHNPIIQVRCIQFAEFENTASDYYYIFTYGKPVIAQLHSTLSYSKWSNVKVRITRKQFYACMDQKVSTTTPSLSTEHCCIVLLCCFKNLLENS